MTNIIQPSLEAMKLPRNTLLGCVLIVCLTLLIFTYLTRKSLCEIRYRDTNREVAAFLAYESAKLTPAGKPRHSGEMMSDKPEAPL
jgi:protein HokB